MPKQMKIKNNKQNIVFASVILFFVLSFALVINAVVNNSQAEWAIIPDIRLVGEYKIGDSEWKPIVEGEHISATKGDVMLRGVLEILDPETNELFGTVENGVFITQVVLRQNIFCNPSCRGNYILFHQMPYK